ncbi:unnamed protein product [Symbiodinium sp. CCMP2592]|nr:unnamed protein product [Symbiodinium sp. CCMP2592]
MQSMQIPTAFEEKVDSEPSNAIAEVMAEVVAGMKPVSATVLRATRACDALEGFGSALRGSKALHHRSYETHTISMFWSHSWHGKAWRKWITLLLFYNGWAATAIACIGSTVASVLFALEVLPVLGPDNFTEYVSQDMWQSFWAALVGMILYLSVLVFWRPSGSIFLDMICIDQVNKRNKGQALLSMGAFLKSSESMLVLWDATYSDRLWTMFEIAGFLKSRKEGETPRIVLRPTMLGPCYLVQTLTLFLLLTLLGNISMHISGDGQQAVWTLYLLVVFGVLYINAAGFRIYFRSVNDSMDRLACWRLADVSCFCCSDGHNQSRGLCDREIVLKCIRTWFGSVEEFEHRVRTELLDTFSYEQSRQPFTYGQVAIALVPFFWSSLDRASVWARFAHDLDTWSAASGEVVAAREVIRGLGLWLGVCPVAFLIQCRLACCLQRKCRWSICEHLLNSLPVFATGLFFSVHLLLEQLLFYHPFIEYDGHGHLPSTILLTVTVLPLAWLLYRYVGAGPVVRARRTIET